MRGRDLVNLLLSCPNPGHPVGTMMRIACSSPDPGEGGRYHLRSMFADEVLRDYTAACQEDPIIFDEYEDGYHDFMVIRAACTRSAIKAIIQWREEDARCKSR